MIKLRLIVNIVLKKWDLSWKVKKKIHLTSSVKWNFSNTGTPLMRTSVNNIWNNVSEPKSEIITLASAFFIMRARGSAPCPHKGSSTVGGKIM